MVLKLAYVAFLPIYSAGVERALGEKAQALSETDAEVDVIAVNRHRNGRSGDVPVGTALSGGIDSSAIVMSMRRLTGEGADLHAFGYVADDERVKRRALDRSRWGEIRGDGAQDPSRARRSPAGPTTVDSGPGRNLRKHEHLRPIPHVPAR